MAAEESRATAQTWNETAQQLLELNARIERRITNVRLALKSRRITADVLRDLDDLARWTAQATQLARINELYVQETES